MVATFKQGRQTANICINVSICIYRYISYINILGACEFWYCAPSLSLSLFLSLSLSLAPSLCTVAQCILIANYPLVFLETKAIFTSSKSKSRYCNLGIKSPPHLFQTTQTIPQKIPSLVSLCLLIAPWLKCGDRNLEISSESILSNISSLSSYKLPCMARFWDWCVAYLLPTSLKKNIWKNTFHLS